MAVFFGVGTGEDCSEVKDFPRTIADDADPVSAAFELLVAGPTAEEATAGAGSFFSRATADALVSVAEVDGVLIVDFVDLRPLMPNASTSCGSASLLAALNSTAFQFAEIERVRYRMDGSCDEFANWLQRECFDADREGRQLEVPTNERASESGCTPPPGEGLPTGRWFGFATEVTADRISFDLACWFSGEAAAKAAEEDGEESPPPNDYYIRNESDRVRLLPVDPTAEVAWLSNPGDPASIDVISFGEWVAERAEVGPRPGVWLDIDDGVIGSIEEQYVP